MFGTHKMLGWRALGCGLGVVLIALPIDVSAKSAIVLHSFDGAGEGAVPSAGLVADGKGNFYGTTYTGGSGGAGTIFELTSGGKQKVLYAFPGISGGASWNSLILDKTGNLYGTTYNGGHNCQGAGCGTVYRLARDGTFTTLYAFAGRKDGAKPAAPVIWDKYGNIWGTTNEGGGRGCLPHRGCGTVFELTRTPHGKWKESIIYSFTGRNDGANPVGAPIWDARGNFVITTQYGGGTGCGGTGCGTVFELARSGGTWSQALLFSFDGQNNGAFPQAGVIEDRKGNLVGTTLQGGSAGPRCFENWGCGTVFRLAPNGSEMTLHTFTGGSDGGFSLAHLIEDAKGNLYGTTAEGGSTGCLGYGCGTVFKITPDGRETVLLRFSCKTTGCTPTAGMIADDRGILYGTTEDGGIDHRGIAYKIRE